MFLLQLAIQSFDCMTLMSFGCINGEKMNELYKINFTRKEFGKKSSTNIGSNSHARRGGV
jgi:hypothetical protein